MRDTGRVCANHLKRLVRRDDHELVLVLSELKFVREPVKTVGIESGLFTKIKVLVRHRIVEHDDLQRHVGLRLKAVTGKVIGDVGLGETMTDRL